MGCAATLLHNCAIGRLSRQRLLQQHRYYVLLMPVNGAWTTFSLVSWRILRHSRRHCAIIRSSASFVGENSWDNTATMTWIWASTERQQLLPMHLGQSEGSAATLTHIRTIRRHSEEKFFWQHRHYAPEMSVNSAVTIWGVLSWNIKGLGDCNDP